jgi:hypothetical protein
MSADVLCRIVTAAGVAAGVLAVGGTATAQMQSLPTAKPVYLGGQPKFAPAYSGMKPYFPPVIKPYPPPGLVYRPPVFRSPVYAQPYWWGGYTGYPWWGAGWNPQSLPWWAYRFPGWGGWFTW